MAGASPSAIKQSTENVRYAMRANYARRAARRRRMRRFEDHTTSASNRGPSRPTRPRQRPGPRSRQAGPPSLPSRLAAKVNVGDRTILGFPAIQAVGERRGTYLVGRGVIQLRVIGPVTNIATCEYESSEGAVWAPTLPNIYKCRHTTRS